MKHKTKQNKQENLNEISVLHGRITIQLWVVDCLLTNIGSAMIMMMKAEAENGLINTGFEIDDVLSKCDTAQKYSIPLLAKKCEEFLE